MILDHELDDVFDRCTLGLVNLGQFGVLVVDLVELLFEKLHVAGNDIELLSSAIAAKQLRQRQTASFIELFQLGDAAPHVDDIGMIVGVVSQQFLFFNQQR